MAVLAFMVMSFGVDVVMATVVFMATGILPQEDMGAWEYPSSTRLQASDELVTGVPVELGEWLGWPKGWLSLLIASSSYFFKQAALGFKFRSMYKIQYIKG